MSHRCWASQWIDTRVASPRDFLVTLRVFAVSNPSLLRGCLDVLLSCIYINRGDGVVLTRDPEGLGKVATTALLHVAACFSAIVHMPGPFNDVRQKYRGMYLANTEPMTYHSLHYTMETLHGMACSACTHGFPYIGTATTLHFRNFYGAGVGTITWSRCQRGGCGLKVSRWSPRFVLYSLTQSALPPAPPIASCLSVVALEAGGIT